MLHNFVLNNPIQLYVHGVERLARKVTFRFLFQQSGVV